MTSNFYNRIGAINDTIKSEGLWKTERVFSTAQGPQVEADGARLINLCANNYLGLANHPSLIVAANSALERFGYGLASVRFICGTQTLHRELEQRLARFLHKEDSILLAACFDANGALFEPLFAKEDAIVSDALNHASIIDGIRLCKARRYRYRTGDMSDLEAQLAQARNEGARDVAIVTDGVFSMDGRYANLPQIKQLADQYNALIIVDDCHATGFVGPAGRGTAAHFGVEVDILTGTFGKALGGGLGGYIAASTGVIELLRQRARPYLFSNSLPPAIVGASLEAIEIVEKGDDLRAKLFANASFWREGLVRLGFDVPPGDHPIVVVMLGEARLAQEMAARLFERGVYVTGFFFPVVPKGEARIRTQMSASHERENLEFALDAFAAVGRELELIK